MIDLCNAISRAFAIPVAVFDVSEIAEHVEVRYANSDEVSLAFSGAFEHSNAHEVIFADNAGRAHARRWTIGQSAYSAIRNTTASIMVVAEAMHGSAPEEVRKLRAAIANELNVVWSIALKTAIMDSRDIQESPYRAKQSWMFR